MIFHYSIAFNVTLFNGISITKEESKGKGSKDEIERNRTIGIGQKKKRKGKMMGKIKFMSKMKNKKFILIVSFTFSKSS